MPQALSTAYNAYEYIFYSLFLNLTQIPAIIYTSQQRVDKSYRRVEMTGLVDLGRIHKKLNRAIHFMLVFAVAMTHFAWVPAQVHAASEARVSEFMANPAVISDGDGEWIEIQNNLDTVLDLTGWTLSEQDGVTHELEGAILPNGFFVVCRGTTADADVPCDNENSGLQLNNARGDTITLKNPAADVIDEVVFEGTNFTDSNAEPGQSAVVHNDGTITNDNVNQYTATGPNHGTPGAASDLQAPEVEITSHTSGDTEYTDFTVSGTVTDEDSGVDRVRVRFFPVGTAGGGGSVANFDAILDESTNTFTIDLVAGDDVPFGDYDLVARAHDNDGNAKSDIVTPFTLAPDTFAPEITITAPANNSIHSNYQSIFVEGTVIDEHSAVDAIALRIGRPGSPAAILPIQEILNPTTEEFSFEIPADTLTDEGWYRLAILARDDKGNRADREFVRVYIDRTAPETAPLFTPADDSVWTSPICIAGATADNTILDHINLYAKPAGATDETYELITELELTEESTDFSSVPEECEETLASGSLGEFEEFCRPDIQDSVEPENEVRKRYFATCWYYVWNPLTDDPFFVGESHFDIKAAGVDDAGNEEESAYAYNVLWDVQAPVVNAGPNRIDCVKFTRTGTATDNGSGIKSVKWSVVSGPGTVTFGSPDKLTTTMVADEVGTYVIRLTATDNVGNVAHDDFTLTWIAIPSTVLNANGQAGVIEGDVSGPDTVDSDGDGYSDQEEIDAGTNPNDANDFPGANDNTDGEEDVLSDEDNSFNFWWIVLLGGTLGLLYFLLARRDEEETEE